MLLARFLFQEASLFLFLSFRKVSWKFIRTFLILPVLPLPKRCFFDPPRPSLAKEGSTAFPKPLSPQGTGDVTALRCSEPLRSKVGGASKPSPYFAGWDRLGTAGEDKKRSRNLRHLRNLRDFKRLKSKRKNLCESVRSVGL